MRLRDWPYGLVGAFLAVVLHVGWAWAFDTTAPVQVNPQNSYASASASNATAVIAAASGKRARVNAVSAWCNVGAASLTISNGATQIWADLVTTTALRFSWATPLASSSGAAMTVTVSSCGTGNVGHLSVEGDSF